MHPLLRVNHYIGEFLATFIFVFVGVLGVALLFGVPELATIIPSNEIRLILAIVIFAGIIALIIYSPLGKLSGAHINPAVSFAFFMEGHLDVIDFIGYVFVQCVAAIAACMLLGMVIPEAAQAVEFGLTKPASHEFVIIEFISEVISTLVLITVIFFCLNNEKTVKYTGMLVSLYIFFIALMTAGLTGASMNPVRSLGPAVASGMYGDLWLYLAAPMLGSFLAVVLHRWWWLLNRPKFHRLNHTESYKKLIFGRHPELK